jgi:hypothetical protein
MPESQDWEDITGLVFPGLQENSKATIDFQEEQDYVPEQRYEDQEPILPYNTSGEDNDIHAGFIRIAYTASSSSTVTDGNVDTTTTTTQNSTGQYLENNEIMTEECEGNIGEALNEWITYSMAQTNFSFKYGGNRLHFESEPEESERDIRNEFTIKGSDKNEGIKYYSATRTDESRGTHLIGSLFSFGNVDIDEIASLSNWTGGNITSMPSDYNFYSQEDDMWNPENMSETWE